MSVCLCEFVYMCLCLFACLRLSVTVSYKNGFVYVSVNVFVLNEFDYNSCVLTGILNVLTHSLLLDLLTSSSRPSH